MWVQVPSSARKTQVERLESFCVIEKIVINAKYLGDWRDDTGIVESVSERVF